MACHFVKRHLVFLSARKSFATAVHPRRRPVSASPRPPVVPDQAESKPGESVPPRSPSRPRLPLRCIARKGSSWPVARDDANCPWAVAEGVSTARSGRESAGEIDECQRRRYGAPNLPGRVHRQAGRRLLTVVADEPTSVQPPQKHRQGSEPGSTATPGPSLSALSATHSSPAS